MIRIVHTHSEARLKRRGFRLAIICALAALVSGAVALPASAAMAASPVVNLVADGGHGDIGGHGDGAGFNTDTSSIQDMNGGDEIGSSAAAPDFSDSFNTDASVIDSFNTDTPFDGGGSVAAGDENESSAAAPDFSDSLDTGISDSFNTVEGIVEVIAED
ncbi:hypothetical protein [Streptomyces sp. NPDC059874]|uniref:hypothetical protein n=1 Tax=Streptomyces sp. NPDC059874 TaxID=3346983 RepID=UPI00365F287C